MQEDQTLKERIPGKFGQAIEALASACNGQPPKQNLSFESALHLLKAGWSIQRMGRHGFIKLLADPTIHAVNPETSQLTGYKINGIACLFIGNRVIPVIPIWDDILANDWCATK